MTQHTANSPLLILTIGHSTRTLEIFVDMLHTHNVTRVVDVRTLPRSRHNPQFNLETLPESLKVAGIAYTYLAELGGLRHPQANSINTGWRNASFRGYADYMQTTSFAQNLQQLIDLAQQDRIAVMCAEAVPWRCHRSLIADALQARGIVVEHIMSKTQRRIHTLTPFAKICGTTITYPSEASEDATLHSPSGLNQ